MTQFEMFSVSFDVPWCQESQMPGYWRDIIVWESGYAVFLGLLGKKKWWNVYLMSYRGDSKRPREDLDPQPGTYLMSVFSGTDRRWPLVVWTEHEASYHHPVAWGPRGAQGPVSTKSRGTRIQRTERSRGPERGPRGPKDPKTQRTRGGPRRSGEPGEPWGPRGPKGPWGPDTSFFPLLFP